MTGIDGARWQGDSLLHLTLRFIGPVDEGVAATIDRQLATVGSTPPSLRISGVGRFGRRGHRGVIWAGVEADLVLTALQARIEQAMQDIGLAPEPRPFRPHVTLGRLDRDSGPTDAYLAAWAGLSSPAFVIRDLTLFESSQARSGLRYLTVATYPLAGKAESVSAEPALPTANR